MRFRIKGDVIQRRMLSSGSWVPVALVVHTGESKLLVRQANEFDKIIDAVDGLQDEQIVSRFHRKEKPAP